MTKKILLLLFVLSIVPLISISAELIDESTERNPEGGLYKEKDFTNAVILRGLNKITARVSSLNISLDEKATFGNLEISLLRCWKAPPEEEPENKALLKIFEQIPGEDKREIFYGWMFASTPALSALEHPVYDVTVIECIPKPVL